MVELLLFGVAFLALAAAALCGHVLVVEKPRRAEVIVVIGGEGNLRIQRGLQLLREGHAPRLVVTARTTWRLFGWTEADLAQRFVSQLEPEVSQATSVVQITSQCTWEEAAAVNEFLRPMGVRSALLVTSQYHSRRALSIFRRMLPGIECGIVGVPEPYMFGVQWWQHREWAKCTFQEWTHLLWWLAVDRWIAPRHGAALAASHAGPITLSSLPAPKK
jgi:uncharacterized SAM-binding protein YcdF (DUF218 family)